MFQKNNGQMGEPVLSLGPHYGHTFIFNGCVMTEAKQILHVTRMHHKGSFIIHGQCLADILRGHFFGKDRGPLIFGTKKLLKARETTIYWCYGQK